MESQNVKAVSATKQSALHSAVIMLGVLHQTVQLRTAQIHRLQLARPQLAQLTLQLMPQVIQQIQLHQIAQQIAKINAK